MAKQMKMSARGKELLAQWEGIRLHPYVCSAGKYTIGVGHVLTDPGYVVISGQKVPVAQGITKDQVMALFTDDIAQFETHVAKVVQVSLSQNQFDALVSLCFNIGQSAFSSSTLLKVLNAGKYTDVPAQFARWNKIDGEVSTGLTNRRVNEIALWNGQVV